MNATQAFHAALAGDPDLIALLASYKGNPAVFTIDPVPGDADTPYVVTVGEAVHLPWDTKTSRGREFIRDIRAYADEDGNNVPVEAIAERVRAIFHRRALVIGGYNWIISDVTGPIVADGPGFYGRVVSVTVKAQEA